MVSTGFFLKGVLGATGETGNGDFIVLDLKVVNVPFPTIGASVSFWAKTVIRLFLVVVGHVVLRL